MAETPKNGPETLSDNDIKTETVTGRRAFMGLVATGSIAAAVAPGRTEAQASDSDDGTWTDSGSCPRGSGGVYTNYTDSDDGSWADNAGYGRGAPYC
jgi:hypothetical protein